MLIRTLILACLSFMVAISFINSAVINRNYIIPKTQTLNNVTFSANNINYNYKTNTLIATNNVVISSTQLNITADQVYYDTTNKLIIAKGNVVYKNLANDVIKLQYLELDQETSTFLMDNIKAYLQGGASLISKKLTKSNATNYNVTSLVYTTCKVPTNKSPTWDVLASKGKYNDSKNTIILYNAIFRIKTIPVLWLPIVQFSNIANKRKIGFLVPSLYFNSQSNKIVFPFYIPIGNSNDITIDTYLYTNKFKKININSPLFNAKYNGYFANTQASANASWLIADKVTINKKPQQNQWSWFSNTVSYINPSYRITTHVEKTTSVDYLNSYSINPKSSSNLFLNSYVYNEVFLNNNYFNLTTNIDNNIEDNKLYRYAELQHKYFNNNATLGSINISNTAQILNQNKYTNYRIANNINVNKQKFYKYLQVSNTVELQSVYNKQAQTKKYLHYSALGLSSQSQIPFIKQYNTNSYFLFSPTAQYSYSAKFLQKNTAKTTIDANSIYYTKNNLFSINHYQGYDNFEENASVKYGAEAQFSINNNSIGAFAGQLINLLNKDSTKQTYQSNYFGLLNLKSKYIQGEFEGIFSTKLKLLSGLSSLGLNTKYLNINVNHKFYQNLNPLVYKETTQHEIGSSAVLKLGSKTKLGANASFGIYTKEQIKRLKRKNFDLKSLSYFLQWRDSCDCMNVNINITQDVYRKIPSSYSITVRLKKF